MADKIVIDFLSDNGNKNVAMFAIMPIRSNVHRAPVANSCNHRTQNGRYLLWDAFDDDVGTQFKANCDGHITLPKLGKPGILSIASSAEERPITITISDDLREWTSLGEIMPTNDARRAVSIPSDVFVRIEMPENTILDGIKYEEVLTPTAAIKEKFVPGIRAFIPKE